MPKVFVRFFCAGGKHDSPPVPCTGDLAEDLPWGWRLVPAVCPGQPGPCATFVYYPLSPTRVPVCPACAVVGEPRLN